MRKDSPRADAYSGRRDEYVSRVNRVIDYIDANIDRAFTLEELAEVACFSAFHFHRIFGAMVGESLGGFIQRIRIEKAASQLVAFPRKPITQIALDCGFSSSATFARAFRQAYSMSASQWRAQGCGQPTEMDCEDSKNRKADGKEGKDQADSSRYSGVVTNNGDIESRSAYRRRKAVFDRNNVQVKVEEMQPFHVAYVRHIGPYKGNTKLFEDLFGRLMKWAGPRDLVRPDAKVLTIYHDNPDLTDEGRLRVSACISIPDDTTVEGEIGKMAIAGGKYAFARFKLKPDQYQEAWSYLMAGWLPESGYQPDDRPCFEMYGEPSNDPTGEHTVFICLPVKPL